VRGPSHKYSSGICSGEQEVHTGTKSQVTCIMKHFPLGQSYSADSLKCKVLHSDFNFQMKCSEKCVFVAEVVWSPVLPSLLFTSPLPSQVSYKIFLWEKTWEDKQNSSGGSWNTANNLSQWKKYPWEIWKDHRIITVIHDWKTISDSVN